MHSSGNEIQQYTDAFRRGEEKGFTYFFRQLYPALLYFSFRIVKDRTIAEDIVEESFIKIWERHSQFSHPKVISAWLYTTVRNGSLNRLEKEKREQEHKGKLAEQPLPQEESTLNAIIRSEVIREVHASIETLPRACRTIFQMMYIRGMTVREIAEELKLSTSTVKNQKARGLSILRKRFPHISVAIFIMLLNEFARC